MLLLPEIDGPGGLRRKPEVPDKSGQDPINDSIGNWKKWQNRANDEPDLPLFFGIADFVGPFDPTNESAMTDLPFPNGVINRPSMA